MLSIFRLKELDYLLRRPLYLCLEWSETNLDFLDIGSLNLFHTCNEPLLVCGFEPKPQISACR